MIANWVQYDLILHLSFIIAHFHLCGVSACIHLIYTLLWTVCEVVGFS